MAAYPSMPLFTDAYIADTTHLSAEEHGVYFLLLVCAWRSEGCKLKNNDIQLARMGRVTPAKWRKIKDTILAFWTVEGEYIKQKKLTEIYKKVQNSVQQKKKAGKASATRKSLNNNKTGSTAVDAPLQRGANGKSTNQNQNQIDNDINISSSGDDRPDFNQKVVEAAGLHLTTCFSQIHLITNWLNKGLDEKFILGEIGRIRSNLLASGKDQPSSLAYYDKCFSKPLKTTKPTIDERLAAI
jgi:uncharacterized protein YdaU (DUF1376 family)